MTSQQPAKPREVILHTCQVQMTNFFHEMANPDEDYAIFAFQAFEKCLETNHQLIVPPNAELMFLNKFIEKIGSKNDLLVNAVFKVLSLLIKYFKPSGLKIILTALINTSRQPDFDSAPQILTIIKDNLAQSNTFDEERNSILFETLFTTQKNELTVQQDDNLLFLLDLYISLYDHLGNRASTEDNQFIIDKVKWLLTQNMNNEDITSSLIDLIKSWCKFATEGQIADLIEYTKQDSVKDTPVPFNVVAALTGKSAKHLLPHLEYVIPIILGVINEISASIDEGTEPTDEIILRGSNAITALARIVDTFPEHCQPRTEEFFTIAFQFLTYGVDTLADAKNDEEEDDDDDIEFSSDDDDIAVDPDMIEGDLGISDNSTWQFRRAAITLSTSLLNNYSEEFLAYFLGQYEDFNTCLQDSDIGVQIDTLEIIAKIYQKFKQRISEEITELIVSTICRTVNFEQQKSALGSLNALIVIVPIVGGIKSENAVTILTSLANDIQAPFANQAFRLALTIIKLNNSPEVIESTCNLLLATNTLPTSFIATAIEVTAEVYTITKEASAPIIELNKYIISTSSKGLECVIAALPTLAIFIASYDGAESTAESIEFIKESFPKAMVRKSLLGSLIILAVSPIAEKILKPLIKLITETLIAALKGNDSMIQFRALWIMKLLCEKKILAGDDLQAVLPACVGILTLGDARSRTLALSNLNNNMSPNIVDSTIQKLKESISSSTTPSFLKHAVTFLKANLSDKIINEFIELGDSLIKQGDRGERTAHSIATILGLAIAETPFASKLPLATTRFTTLVAGSLGSVTDISANTELVDNLFKHATDQSDRAEFTAAAEAIGKCSVASPSIRDRLVLLSDKDDQHISAWIVAFGALASSSIGRLTIKELGPAAKYLLQCRGGEQNTKACAEALSYLAEADHAFIQEYFKDAKPIPIYALSLLSARASEELLGTLIEGAITLCNGEQPLLASHALNILINAMRYQNLIPAIIQDCGYLLSCATFSKEHHIVEETIFSEVIEKDIGLSMRLNALELLSLISDYVNPEPAIHQATLCLVDPNISVVSSALGVLAKYAHAAPEEICQLEDDMMEYLQKCEKTVKNEQAQTLRPHFCSALGTLAYVGFGSKKFLDLTDTYKLDPNYVKAQHEEQQTVVAAPTSRASVLSDFVSRYNSDAAVIFTE